MSTLNEHTGAVDVPMQGVVCSLCGIAFAAPQLFVQQLAATRSSIVCPAGHVRPVHGMSPHDRKIAQQGLHIAELEALLVAVRADNAKLRRTTVDRLVGGPTAEEPTS